MTLVKFKPSTSRDFLRDAMVPSHMLNLFDSFFNESPARFERHGFFTPRVDVVETAQNFEIHMALPGLKKEEITLELDGDKLTISGERKMREGSTGEKLHLVEQYYGKFLRTFTLPENSNKQAVEATFTDGILTVTLPKAEAKETKSTVKIK